jgi:hypothetical protein
MAQMNRASIAAVLLLATLGAAHADAADCTLKLVASYDMEPTTLVIAVPLVIAGKQRYVSLDTGSFGSWATKKLVNDAQLETHTIRSDMKIYGARDRVTKYVVVPSVDIGPIHQSASNFMLEPGDMGDLSASLGNNALAQFDIELDFGARKVKFFSQDHCDGRVVYWTKAYTELPFTMMDELIHITMTLDGHDLDTVFDTGTTYTYINKRVLVGTFGRDASSLKEATLGGGGKVHAAPFESLSIGGVTFPHPSLIVMEDTMREFAKEDVPLKEQNQAGVILAHFPHLLLGLDAISHLHLYIAFKEHKIYVTAADAH